MHRWAQKNKLKKRGESFFGECIVHIHVLLFDIKEGGLLLTVAKRRPSLTTRAPCLERDDNIRLSKTTLHWQGLLNDGRII